MATIIAYPMMHRQPNMQITLSGLILIAESGVIVNVF